MIKHKAISESSINFKNRTIGNVTIPFKNHETIHTENPYKYSNSEFQKLASASGFVHEKTRAVREGLFSLDYLSAM
ncbi:L-histidine N(alpha)-methyltransferase [Pseudalkalibacillus hwajinpoensis]|uniref:Histidine-specific methyltransferase SAM-dependent domain-containing protein n=1 Tax=Guptibacillus hwajinpoensis TaxID=208199 RepID=A0A4U1MLD3_9BACL|nr:L-histidine N(alpha)-methyltransferase [Pseudalkalibacillus hwajinpoensis]TKD71446.1 hypothetical protein FBF83_01135 [Pseudalkalibacillus hwajinpoensis]